VPLRNWDLLIDSQVEMRSYGVIAEVRAVWSSVCRSSFGLTSLGKGIKPVYTRQYRAGAYGLTAQHIAPQRI